MTVQTEPGLCATSLFLEFYGVTLNQRLDAKSTLLFLCCENFDQGRLAARLFQSQAENMELSWTAATRTLATDLVNDAGSIAEATLNDLVNSNLTIVLAVEEVNVKALFPTWHGKYELWQLKHQSDPTETIQQNVNSLIVRLILQSGKRAPLAPPPPKQPVLAAAGKPSAVRVSLDSKARRGKKVTVVTGLALDEAALNELAASLKQTCGSGGTVKDGQIEIQ